MATTYRALAILLSYPTQETAALMPAVTAKKTGRVPMGSMTTHKVIRSVIYWLMERDP